MKKVFPVLFVFILLIAVITFFDGWRNKQTSQITFYSGSLHKNMKIDIYLPPGYNKQTRYPVLYVLHGKDANQDSWMNGFFGINGLHIDTVSNTLLAQKNIKPMIIVSPEIDNSYGINTSQTTYSQNGYDHGKYEDYLYQELIPYIDTHYTTIQSGSGRYIAGFSMGGFTALHLAFEHPESFSKVAGLSAAIWEGQYPKGLQELSWVYPNSSIRKQLDPLILANTNPIQSEQIFLDNGDSDMDWIESTNRILYNELQHQGDRVKYHVGHGGHDYGYWGTRVQDLLLFFDQV